MDNLLLARASDTRWPVGDIIYTAIVGLIMLAALLEWLLWLLAFVYCLIKVYTKANETKISTRILAVTHIVIFVCIRCIFLPIMIVTLPLPPQVARYLPSALVSILQWFAFYTFAGLLTVPWLFCIYQLVTHDIGRRQRTKAVVDGTTAPKIVIIMPCYNEEPAILLRTINSIVDCDYPSSCIHIFLSFDGDRINDLFMHTIEQLGVPIEIKLFPQSIDIEYRQTRITVSRFKHGGKRHCQKHTFRLVDHVYQDYLRRNDNIFVLFIDSDCVLDRYCIQSFLYEMELRPGSQRNVLAQTGVITSTTTKNTLITILQDMEYIHGQLFERTVESGCGAVTCLPGALTILRMSAFRKVAKYYFADKAEQCNDLFDYCKMHLGEDRWLTHLFMVSSTGRYQIQMNTGAFCKTQAVQTFNSLLKQRRRWFLGFITNEAVMLTDARLWWRYPILMVIRLAQNTIRTTALLFLIMVIAIMTTSQKVTNLPFGFIAISLGLNWALMLYFGAKLGRYKIMLFPLMFVLNPFFNWTYMVYGIFTAGQRTWGGPRADASRADEETSTKEAIRAAESTGNDLNIVPETFGTARRKLKKRTKMAMLSPANSLSGRFSAAEALPGGWFQQTNGSGVLGQHRRGQSRPHRMTAGQDSSPDSSASNSPVPPRRVASLIRSAKREERAPTPLVTDKYVPLRRRASSLSLVSTDSVPLHFPVPRPRVKKELSAAGMQVEALTPLVSRARSWSYYHRKGRSPLARKSFTKLAADQKTEVSVSTGLRAVSADELRRDWRFKARPSQDEPRGRTRQRPNVSIDSQGRRRLSKQSRASSTLSKQ